MSNHKYIKEKKLRSKTVAELTDMIRERKTDAFENRFKKVTGALDDYRQIPANKRNLATVFTLLREKQLEAQYGPEWRRKSVRQGVK